MHTRLDQRQILRFSESRVPGKLDRTTGAIAPAPVLASRIENRIRMAEEAKVGTEVEDPESETEDKGEEDVKENKYSAFNYNSGPQHNEEETPMKFQILAKRSVKLSVIRRTMDQLIYVPFKCFKKSGS